MLVTNQLLQKRYRIVRQLGHGGMGAVYEAIDEKIGTPVALKEILIELNSSTNEKQKDLMIKAFEREAKSLAKASHEAIPYIRDYFSELDRQFLVMELVEGDDLAELLKKRGEPFPLEDVLSWMDQLLDALDYLHNLKPPIIHRDIKPQNLKLNHRRKIKLLDFGIAKSNDIASTFSTNQTFVGATLNYSPIEQIMRALDPTFREFIILKHKVEAEKVLNQNTDSSCDIYALGTTFYHLLTNRLPIDSTKRILEIWEGKPDPLPNPSELNSEIPPAISACLLKAMEIERENRFSSAVEMQEALQNATSKVKQGKRKTKKTLPSPKPIAKVEEIHQAQKLTQAKTVRLIERSEVRTSSENIIVISETRPADTQPSIMLPSDTQSLGVETAESSLMEVFDSEPLGSGSRTELTGMVYFDERLMDSKKPSEPLPISKIKTESQPDDPKAFWVLPITAVCILIIGGIGGIIWSNSSVVA